MSNALAHNWANFEEDYEQSGVLALQRVKEISDSEWSVSMGEVRMRNSGASNRCSHSSWSVGC